MASNIVRQLRQDLARLEVDIARLSRQADALRGTIAFYEEQVESAEPPQPTKALKQAVIAVLEQAKEPMHYRQIYDLVKERGVLVGGKDPASNVIAHMSGDERFVNVGRGVWGLARWQQERPPATVSDIVREASRLRDAPRTPGSPFSRDEAAPLTAERMAEIHRSKFMAGPATGETPFREDDPDRSASSDAS